MFDIRQKTIGGQHRYYVSGDKQIKSTSPLVSCTAIAGYADVHDVDGLVRWAASAALATGNADESTRVMQAAIDIGNHVHQEIDQYIGDSTPSYPSPFFELWRKALQRKKIEWLASEYRVYNPELKYGGTVDAIGKWGKDIVVFDWKTGNKNKFNFKPSQAVQIAGYCLALEQMHELDPSVPLPTAGLVLYIFKNKLETEWRWINLEQAKETFKLCHGIYTRTLKGGLYE